jgi:hypothetical protein
MKVEAKRGTLGSNSGKLGKGIYFVGQLYDLKKRIEEKIKADGLDAMDMKGKIGLRSGKLFAFITPTTPDDPEIVAKLKQAAKEVLNLSL